jgi:hypothetical protein
MLKTKDKDRKEPSSLQTYGRYSSLAFQMLFIILACVFGGRWIDSWLAWKIPVFTIVLSMLGVIMSIYFAVKDFLKKP